MAILLSSEVGIRTHHSAVCRLQGLNDFVEVLFVLVGNGSFGPLAQGIGVPGLRTNPCAVLLFGVMQVWPSLCATRLRTPSAAS
jgi:hypothetical protein